MPSKEAKKAANKRYRERHPDRVNATHKKWRDNNKAKHKAYRDSYIGNNPDKVALWKQISHFRSYGLSLEEGLKVLSTGCLVCGTQENLCIDHCHKSDIVRGCLCDKHNRGLQLVSESVREAMAMYNYIVNRCGPALQSIAR